MYVVPLNSVIPWPITICLQVRQLAAVELRKRISQGDAKLWLNLAQDERLSLKSHILQVIIAEQASVVFQTCCAWARPLFGLP